MREQRAQTLGELVGAQLRWLREEQGLSQEELARRIGSHRPIISRIERGEHGLSLESVCRIAAGLGVDPAHDVLVVLDGWEVLPGGALVMAERRERLCRLDYAGPRRPSARRAA